MLKKRIFYSLPALKTLVASENSSVYCIENCKRCFTASPSHLGDLRAAVREYLNSKVTSYDPELQGIIMSHKNVRVVNSSVLNDDEEYRFDYISDIYIFRPSVGSILTGKVNKKGQDHLGALVHTVFNATLPRPRNGNDCPRRWLGTSVKIGDQVTFEVVRVNFSSRLPYIKGTLSDYEGRDGEDCDSGFCGQESYEEGSGPMSPRRKALCERSEESTSEESYDTAGRSGVLPRKESILRHQSSLPNQAMADSSSSFQMQIPESPAALENSFAGNKATGKTSKKRKRKSSILEIENSLINSVLACHSPSSSSECQPKVKRKKLSHETNLKSQEVLSVNSESTLNLESTVNNLINAQMSALKQKKKKSRDISGDEPLLTSVASSSFNSTSSLDDLPSLGTGSKTKKSRLSLNLGDRSLSEEAQKMLLVAQQEVLGTPSPSKKRKDHKGKSSEERYRVATEENQSFSSTSDPDQKTEKKKKKKPVLQDLESDLNFSNPERSESVADDGCERRSPSEPVESKKEKKKKKKKSSLFLGEVGTVFPFPHDNEVSLLEQVSSFSPSERYEKTKKKSVSFVGNELSFTGSGSLMSPGISSPGEIQQDPSPGMKVHKKKKKKSKSGPVLEEPGVWDRSAENYAEQDHSGEVMEDIVFEQKQHKKKKKKSYPDNSLDEKYMTDSPSGVPQHSSSKKKKKKSIDS